MLIAFETIINIFPPQLHSPLSHKCKTVKIQRKRYKTFFLNKKRVMYLSNPYESNAFKTIKNTR